MISRLVDIVARLRAPDGCPWDRAQDLQSMKAYLVEEAYEVCEAIERGRPEEIREELGDLLFIVTFMAQLGRENGDFSLDDVAAGICDKMERRHPHVFGEATFEDATAVAANWEEQKAREKGPKGIFDGLPSTLPALHKARRVGEKMAATGFDWPDHTGALEKVHEEIAELDEALAEGDRDHIRDELGDALFVLVSLARKVKVDAEDALRRTLDRAMARFTFMQTHIEASGRTLAEVDLETMEDGWQAAKRSGL